jgi:5-methylcytosine-specific restriction enzyme subunit McrC
LNARYEPALRIAELIFASTSFEQVGKGDAVNVSGFMFDAWKIFEDFVCVALAESMADHAGHAVLQHRDRLDVDGQIPIEPDFTWWDGDRPIVVADAKYKLERPAGFPNADSYQVLAYCTALGVEDGHLVYAKGEADPKIYQVQRSPVRIHRHTLDLGRPPMRMLDDVRTLAMRISECTLRRGAGSDVRPNDATETAAVHDRMSAPQETPLTDFRL